jgi:lysozyme
MDLISRLMEDEGYRQHPYKCTADKWTIGYGRNLEAKGISRHEAILMLKNDVNECEADLRELFGPAFWDTIDKVRQNAMLNMRFQLGGRGFRGFVNMIDAIMQRKWIEAGWAALDSKWARVDSPRRAQRIAHEIKDGVDLL